MAALPTVLILSSLLAGEPASGGCAGAAWDAERLNRAQEGLTATIVHDVFPPPVASRIYVYASIAAHEALVASGAGAAPTLAGRLRALEPPPAPEGEVCPPVAALVALLEAGRALTFSEASVVELRTTLLGELRDTGVAEDLLERSTAYGEQVGKHVLRWANGDLYRESRSFTRHSPSGSPDQWVPTGPDYMDAIEPNWMRIRTLVLDRADELRPPPPPAYSTEPDSQFRREALEVYETARQLGAERAAIARFWDDNPFAVTHSGHLMLGIRRTSPGGHWMGIAGIACRQAGADFATSAWVYAATSVALFDGFISCWEEKYRSNVVRPETYIGRTFEPGWRPLLQTPPFPEYTSGHSVISSAAATVLTALFGDGFAYTDTTEVQYGLEVRSFPSFLAAAEEAAISRLYGGIHYRAAIENGGAQGRALGRRVVERLGLAALRAGAS